MSKQYNLKNIRALLLHGFTVEELRRFSFDNLDFRPVYDALAEHTGKAKFIDLLMEYAEQKSKIEILLVWAKENNPDKYEEYQSLTFPRFSRHKGDRVY